MATEIPIKYGERIITFQKEVERGVGVRKETERRYVGFPDAIPSYQLTQEDEVNYEAALALADSEPGTIVFWSCSDPEDVSAKMTEETIASQYFVFSDNVQKIMKDILSSEDEENIAIYQNGIWLQRVNAETLLQYPIINGSLIPNEGVPTIVYVDSQLETFDELEARMMSEAFYFYPTDTKEEAAEIHDTIEASLKSNLSTIYSDYADFIGDVGSIVKVVTNEFGPLVSSDYANGVWVSNFNGSLMSVMMADGVLNGFFERARLDYIAVDPDEAEFVLDDFLATAQLTPGQLYLFKGDGSNILNHVTYTANSGIVLGYGIESFIANEPFVQADLLDAIAAVWLVYEDVGNSFIVQDALV